MKNKDTAEVHGRAVRDARDVMTVKGDTGRLSVLTGNTSEKVRGLWERVFTDESRRYNDFYFKRKAADSLCYSFSTDASDSSQAMLIRTPYSVALRTETGAWKMKADYIVGVATDRDFRHQGFMDCILKYALNDMYKDGLPFTFLIPADPAIYSSYGFRYFYFRKHFDKMLRFAAADGRYYDEELEEPSEEWQQFEKKAVKKEYSAYIRRSGRYYRDLFDECRADAGGTVMIRRKSDGTAAGCYTYITEDDRRVITGVAADGELEEVCALAGQQRSPFMMGRIVNAQDALEQLRTKKKYDRRVVLKFSLSDDIIAENNGCYECRVSDRKCKVKRIQGKGTENCPQLDITDLLDLFGTADTQDCGDFDKNAGRLFSFEKCVFNELS